MKNTICNKGMSPSQAVFSNRDFTFISWALGACPVKSMVTRAPSGPVIMALLSLWISPPQPHLYQTTLYHGAAQKYASTAVYAAW